jgi:hypothetical protein
MSRIEEIFDKVSACYSNPRNEQAENRRHPVDENIQRQLEVTNLLGMSSSYIKAAGAVNADSPDCFLPQLQLSGHSIELALKACIMSATGSFKPGHDLKCLCLKALKHDVVLDDKELECIAHVNHAYFRDSPTDSKYKSRYPSKPGEPRNFVVADHSTLRAIVMSLRQQATDRFSTGHTD